MKNTLKILLSTVLILIFIVVCYGFYVFLTYYRVEDNIKLKVNNATEAKINPSQEYLIMAYNIGFAAYSSDYSFFMDGGEYSRAFSKEEVLKNMNNFISRIKAENPDILLLEEVDTDSDRAYHVNEFDMLKKSLSEYSSVFAQNYDSPYLFYPVTKPHGKSVSGIATFSKFNITSSLRRKLPIEESVWKIIDLDRCYSVTRIPTSNNKELVVYTFHLSAYTKTGDIPTDQLTMLLNDMQAEYEKGNYILAGGDFNKDLLGDTSKYTGIKSPQEYSWNRPINKELFADKNLNLVAPLNEEHPLGSCRNTDKPLLENTYVALLDGFIVSDNIEIINSEVIDTNYDSSDHNPVKMTFKLKETK